MSKIDKFLDGVDGLTVKWDQVMEKGYQDGLLMALKNEFMSVYNSKTIGWRDTV